MAGVKTEIDAFSERSLEVSSIGKQWQVINPATSYNDSTVYIRFDIPASQDLHTDPSYCFISVKGKIVKADGSDPIDADPDVGLANYPIASMFKECLVEINNTVVGNVDHSYGYKAYFHILLNHTKEQMKTHFTPGLWYMDTPGHLDEINAAGQNTGFKARNRYTRNGKDVELIGPIFHPLFMNQGKLIPTNVPIKISFMRQSNAWMLNANTEEKGFYKFQLKSIQLHVLRRKINPDILAIQEREVRGGANYKIPVRVTQVNSFSVSKDSRRFIRPNLFMGTQLPDILHVAFVTSEAFAGTLKSNPYHFPHKKLSTLHVHLDGASVTGRELSGFGNADGALRTIYLNYLNSGYGYSILSREQFEKGYAIYTIDLTPDNAGYDNSFRTRARYGPVSLEGNFEEKLDVNMEVLIVGEFRGQVEINANREVFTDY